MNGKKKVGVIKFYSQRKRYGFITRPDGSDVFFHLSHFRSLSTPVPGNVVEFLEGQNEEGPTAEEVIVVPHSYVTYYTGVITQLTFEGGVIERDDGQGRVNFLRRDFIPHYQAHHLSEGDRVAMCFLVEEEEGLRAAVVRPVDYDPYAVTTAYAGRRETEDEQENRRLLGILYRTDLDAEAVQTARTLCGRNLRATLSALAARALDPSLALETRRLLVQCIPDIYLDEEGQEFLRETSACLLRLVEAEPQSAPQEVRTLLGWFSSETFFPLKWSQYLLPYSLTILQRLTEREDFPMLLQQAAIEKDRVLRLLERACKHVGEHRTGFSYVLTTLLTAFGALWNAGLCQAAVQEYTSRVLQAVDGEELTQQLHFLRDRLHPPYIEHLLNVLAAHPELPDALADETVSSVLMEWLEALRRRAEGEGRPLTEILLGLLPILERLCQFTALRDTLERLTKPFWEALTPRELAHLMDTSQFPDEAVWACLRHFDRRGELPALAAEFTLRPHLVAWLGRVFPRPTEDLRRQLETHLAFRLVDQLRPYEDVQPQLKEVVELIFADLKVQLETAPSEALPDLLARLEGLALPGLVEALTRRLGDVNLTPMVKRRIVGFLQTLHPPLAELAELLVAYHQNPQDALAVSDLVTAVEKAPPETSPEMQEFLGVVQERLMADGVTVHDGFITRIEKGLDGQERCFIEGYDVRVPQRLFLDPADFVENQYVRLVQRGGMALGVVRVPVPESQYLCGLLAEPLDIDERNLLYGLIRDPAGKLHHFKVSHIVKGTEVPLQVGTVLKFIRAPAPAEASTDFLAFNVHAALSIEDLPLLLKASEQETDPTYRGAYLQTAVQIWKEQGSEDPASRQMLQTALQALEEDTRALLLDSLAPAERAAVEELLS